MNDNNAVSTTRMRKCSRKLYKIRHKRNCFRLSFNSGEGNNV